MFNWIFWSSVILIIPYGFIFLVISVQDIRDNKWIFIPVMIQIMSMVFIVIMIIKVPCFLIIKIMEYFYRKKYSKYDKISPEYKKKIDPFDEEEWNELWRDKINENRFYKTIKKI